MFFFLETFYNKTKKKIKKSIKDLVFSNLIIFTTLGEKKIIYKFLF